MAEWIETYRGVVSAWECDIAEHFTIAYYFERFADATRNFLELIAEDETLGPSVDAAQGVFTRRSHGSCAPASGSRLLSHA